MHLRKKSYQTPIWLIGLSICFLIYNCGNNTNEAASNKPSPTNVKKELSMGEKVFILCKACHNLKEGEPHKVGPNLYGIFGRKAGTAEGFNYSPALKGSDIIWDENHIRNWMKKPNDYIPGTTMAFIGIQDEDKQTALIEYLKEQTK